MRCDECEAPSVGGAVGWTAVVVDLPDDDEDAPVLIFCPACALREFGRGPKRSRVAR